MHLPGITPGLRGEFSLRVAEEHTAPSIGSGKVRVLATPVMINAIEAAALAAIEHLLPEGYQSLGTHLDVHHVAATPVGMTITATALVEAFAERKVTFKVEARDEVDLIGHGRHERVVVNVAKFDERTAAKAGKRVR
jgi:fluoroacetyl-CoA thioesterase